MRRHAQGSAAGLSLGSGRYRLALLASLVLAATIVLGVGVAPALQTHNQGEDVKTADVPGGTCCVAGLAVDQTGGELYAADANQVERFESDGSYGTTFTVEGSLSGPQDVAVDNSGGGSDGTIYVADSGNNRVDALDSSGALVAGFGTGGRINGSEDSPGDPDTVPTGGFSNPCGLAVDPTNGNLFVADQNNGRVWIFDSSGKYIGRIADSTLAGPCGLAFNSTGELFVRNSYDGKVVRFSRIAATEFNFAGVFYSAEEGGAVDIAVNVADDHVFIDLGNQVREYDSGGSLVSTFGQSSLCCSSAIAVASSTATIYVSQFGEIKTFGPLVALPEATTGGVSEVTGTTATLEGSVDAAGGPEAECEFEYGTDESYGQTAPCEPAGPYPGSEAVHADISGLSPETGYHYRLSATNENSGSQPTSGEDRFFVTDGAPQISALSVSDAETNSIKLHAQITPSGSQTSYRFEYVSASEFESNGFTNAATAPSPDAAVGSGNTPVAVSEVIPGLAPGTRYFFRVVATNEVGQTESAPKSFKTFASPEAAQPGTFPGQGILPEGRAWELVSPPEKAGGDVLPTSHRTRASVSGDAVAFSSLVSFGPAEGAGAASDYLAVRSQNANPGTNGWVTKPITPPHPAPPFALAIGGGTETRYIRDLSPDDGKGIVGTLGALTGDPMVENTFNLYVRTNLRSSGSPEYRLVTECPLCAETGTPLEPTADAFVTRYLSPWLAGASEDFEHVIFESRRKLTADAPDQPPICNPKGDSFFIPLLCGLRLYEWNEGELSYGGRVPASPGVISCNDATGPACKSADVSVAGDGYSLFFRKVPHAISNGAGGHVKVFFTQPTNAAGETASEAGPAVNTSKEGQLYVRSDGTLTEQLNASERSGEPEDQFYPARFLDATPDGRYVFFATKQALTDVAPADGSEKLYVYDTSKPATDPANLRLLTEDQDGLHITSIVGLTGSSSDARYVYFLGTVDGEVDIFLWHDGSLGIVAPITTTSAATLENAIDSGEGVATPLNARVSTDGHRLLFTATSGSGVMSRYGGEDYEQDSASCVSGDSPGSGMCRELYLFTAPGTATPNGVMQCVSCDPSGAPPSESAQGVFAGVNRSGGAAVGPRHYSRVMSSDGSQVFFSSPDRLVPRDINGVSDAYVFNSTDGTVHLLSSGTSRYPAYILENSSSGSDVFFVTREQLSGWDNDASLDLYDARVGGGFPEPPPPPPGCEGDACQPPPIAINDATPSSSTTVGPGNVKRPKKHRRHRRRHHHHKRHHHHRKHHHSQSGKHDRRYSR